MTCDGEAPDRNAGLRASSPSAASISVRFATDIAISEKRKRESWNQIISQICPLEVDRNPVTNAPFWGTVEGHIAGGIFTADVGASSGIVRRTRRAIAERPTDAIYVFQQTDPNGSSFTTWKGRRGGDLKAGDLFIGTTDEPFESIANQDFGHRFWLIPTRLVLPFAQTPSELEAGIWLQTADPCNRMIAAYLAAFVEEGPRMTPQIADIFAGNVGRLLSVASMPRDSTFRKSESVRLTRLTSITQHIETRLADPLLSPTRIAEQLGLSLRSLHAAFEPTEETCAAFISRRRLDEARILVVGAPARGISDIAFGLGFNSMGTFFRTYRNRFGETPTETRHKHAGG